MKSIRRVVAVLVAMLVVVGSVPVPVLAAGDGTSATAGSVGLGSGGAVTNVITASSNATPQSSDRTAGAPSPAGTNTTESPPGDPNATASDTDDAHSGANRSGIDANDTTPSDGAGDEPVVVAWASSESDLQLPNGTVGTAEVATDPRFAPADTFDDTEPIRIYVQLTDPDPAHEAALEALGAEVLLRSKVHVSALATLPVIDRIRTAPFVVHVGPLPELSPPPQPPRRGDGPVTDGISTQAVGSLTSEGVAVIGADRLHAEGVTGAGVTVGIIDGPFDPTNPEIADNVVAYRTYFQGQRIDWVPPQAGQPQHGTAVAEVVLDVAPDAQIYFAQVTDPVAYSAAVEWLVEEEGVDVISSSMGWRDGPADGSSPLEMAVSDAWAAGVPVVISAGNSGDKFWEGPFTDTDGDGFHEFASGRELATIWNRQPLPAGFIVGAVVKWDDWPSSADAYELFVYEQQPNGAWQPVVRQPRNFFSTQPVVSYTTVLREPAGPIAFAVHRGSEAGDDTLELFAVKAPLEGAMPAGSILSPASAGSAIAVGAFNHSDGVLEDYSSHGPTNDGRRGIDVIAPTRVTGSQYGPSPDGRGGFSGTSGAQPHVAGTVALLLGVDPSLTPAEVESLLHTTARDAGAAGPDTATGFGYLDAYAAVSAARTGTPTPTPTPTPPPTPTPGDLSQYRLVHIDPDESIRVVDVNEVYVRSDDSTMSVRVTYNGEIADYLTTDLGVFIDADRDPTTGEDLGVGSAIGPDYAVIVAGDGVQGSLLGGVANVQRWDPLFQRYRPVADANSASVDRTNGVIEVTFPRSAIGDPDAIHYVIRTIDYKNPRGAGLDWAPDLGSSPPSLGWSFTDGPFAPPDAPVLIGAPTEARWQVVASDADDVFRLDFAGMAAQTDGENLFVRLDYHGDYAATSGVRNDLYIDVDLDGTTGRPLAGGFGADYTVTTFPGTTGAAIERWDPVENDFVYVGQVTYIKSEFAREQQVVGVALTDLRVTTGTQVALLARLGVPTGETVDQMPDAGRATFTVGGEAPPTPPAPEPDPIPDPEPPASGVPPGGAWTPLYADGDEGFDPVNLADVAAQTDGQRLYVRVTYHGDYASTSLLDAAVYVDADADETTGFGLTNSLGRQVLGAEYVISARPSGGRVYPWDATAGTFVEGGPALAYDAPDYAADEHVVGAALSDLGVAPTATIDLAVMLFDTSGSQYDRIDEVPNAGESALTFALGADDGGGGDDGPTTPDLQWQPLGTDPDDPALLDLGSVAAAVVDDRLYLRVGYHGDYAASSPVDAAVYVDADADLTTGAVFRDGTDTVVLGADYVISAQPDGTGGVFAWDATSSGFARHADLAFDGPVFDADQHVVAANLSDLGLDGTADTVQVVVRQFDTTGGGFVAVDDLPNVGALTVAIGDGPPAPPTVGAPTGEWFRLGTAADDPAIPVDLAALDAQDDGATLYLRVGFHGDYAATTARTTTVYLDADDDPGTGLRFLSLTGPTFGADYVLEMRPSGTTLQAYDPVTRALVPAGPAAYHAPDFDADTHAVGVTLAQLGVPSPTVVGVLVRQDGLVGTQFRTDQLPASPVAYPVAGGDGAGSDRFEPNDLVGQGPTLTPGTYADLRVVGRDVDRFGVTLAVGDRVTASLASVQGTSAVDLVLRSPDGIARAFADSGSDGTLEYLVPVGEAGTYVLEAAAENETGDATYALTIAVSTATVLPDRFEPNDAIGEETPLTPGTYPDLSIIESDIDGFAVVVDAGATLVVNLTFAHADADLDVRVYAPNGTLLGSGISETDNESVRVVAATTGTYIIDVEAFEGRGAARYDLLVRVEDDGTTPAPPPTPGPGPGDGNGSGPVPFDRPIPGSGSSLPPIDHDGDGRYEDVDGNGRFDFVDVISLVFARLDVVNADPTMRDALNFDGEGNVNFLDVIELVFQL